MSGNPSLLSVAEVNSTGHATRVEKCLNYCYFKRPTIRCFDLPPRPALQNETRAELWRANWTSSWDGVTYLKQVRQMTPSLSDQPRSESGGRVF